MSSNRRQGLSITLLGLITRCGIRSRGTKNMYWNRLGVLIKPLRNQWGKLKCLAKNIVQQTLKPRSTKHWTLRTHWCKACSKHLFIKARFLRLQWVLRTRVTPSKSMPKLQLIDFTRLFLMRLFQSGKRIEKNLLSKWRKYLKWLVSKCKTVILIWVRMRSVKW